eukprot:491532-Pleurochrysis_carterae.AAC.1
MSSNSSDALNPSPPVLRHAYASVAGTSHRLTVGGRRRRYATEAAGSAPIVDGQCDWHPSAPQRRMLPLRGSRSCLHAGSAQR